MSQSRTTDATGVEIAEDVPEGLQNGTITAQVIRDRVWRPPNRENNWTAFCMVGREGSGKSLTTSSILEKCDPSFSPDRVFFDPKDLMEFIAGLTKSERTGKAVLMDEAGVGMGVRSWYDEDQIKVNKAAQTMRDDNMILATTLPSFGLMDSQLRTRHHGFCEMRDLQHGEYAVFSWKDIIVNREEQGGSIKRKQYPRYHHRGRRQKIERLKIAPPSDGFVDGYKDIKKSFKQAYYEEIVEDAEQDEDIGAKEVAAEIITDDRIDEFVSVHGGWNKEYVDKDRIHLEYDELTHTEAKQVKKILAEEWEGPNDE